MRTKTIVEHAARLVELVRELDPLGPGDTPPPWKSPQQLTAVRLSELVADCEHRLPVAYRDAFVEPLKRSANRVLTSHDNVRTLSLLAETLGGAVYQHDPQRPYRPFLRQFLAVVSNFHRSFLSEAKRDVLAIPHSLGGLPPLAAFRQQGGGPFTFPSDMIARLIGGAVGVVSLPERLMAHPVWWLTVAHETVGHDILHADPRLLPDLVAGVRAMFGGGALEPGAEPDAEQIQGLLWSYWVEEVVSDVYAVLNSGPAFAYNLAILLRAFAALSPGAGTSLSMPSRWTPLPVHPPTSIRLHVAAGVVDASAHLAPQDRALHVRRLRQLARVGRSESIHVRGRIEVERDRWEDVDLPIAMNALEQSARRMGGFIATTALRSLGGHSVQDLETWDAADERIAEVIKLRLLTDSGGSNRIVHLGDDAQLLAGATLALIEAPDRYEGITLALQEALQESYKHDPIVGFPAEHAIIGIPFAATAAGPDASEQGDPRSARQPTGVGAPPLPTPQAQISPERT